MATDFLVKQGKVMGGVRLVTDADVAHQTDLTNIRETGTTSSQAISAGTYFYLNDVLVRAKVDIANGATFTLNTNYEVVTAGALNELVAQNKTLTRTTKITSNYILIAMGNLRILNFGLVDAVIGDTLATLNAEDRPAQATVINWWITASSSGNNGTGVFTINPDGTIVLSNSNGYRGTPMLVWTV